MSWKEINFWFPPDKGKIIQIETLCPGGFAISTSCGNVYILDLTDVH